MIYAALPTGSFHGWGVCGKYIVKELLKLTGVKLVTEKVDFNTILDEFDYRLLKGKIIPDDQFRNVKNGQTATVNAPVS